MCACVCVSACWYAYGCMRVLVCVIPRSYPLLFSYSQIRSLQSDNEDQKTEIDLLKRRIEALRKRKDYSLDS